MRVKKNRALAWDTTRHSGENAGRILPRMARDFFALGRVASGPDSAPAQLHAFRLSAKRFRYTLELFEPMFGPMLAVRLEQVRKIQNLLGYRQDCVVLGERLRKKAGETGPIREALAKLNTEGRELEEKFRRYWRATFDAAGAEALWIRHLERRPTEPRAPRGAIRKNAGRKRLTKRSTNATTRR
jgi:CHAD domain-containing protein